MNCREGAGSFSGQLVPHSSVPPFPPLLLAPLAAVTAAGSQADYRGTIRGTTRFTSIPKARFFFSFSYFFLNFHFGFCSRQGENNILARIVSCAPVPWLLTSTSQDSTHAVFLTSVYHSAVLTSLDPNLTNISRSGAGVRTEKAYQQQHHSS